MNEKKVIDPLAVRRTLHSAIVGEPTKPRRELSWSDGLICIVLAVAVLAVIAGPRPFRSGPPNQVNTGVAVTDERPALANRTSCAEIGSSDLRSPPEGLWFQSNCVPIPAPPLIANITNCNRTSLDPAEFRPVAPGLYTTGRTPASQRFLWYASSETCFDLVSARVVTAVCADQTVSFNWNASACSGHGGVLAWVNGR